MNYSGILKPTELKMSQPIKFSVKIIDVNAYKFELLGRVFFVQRSQSWALSPLYDGEYIVHEIYLPVFSRDMRLTITSINSGSKFYVQFQKNEEFIRYVSEISSIKGFAEELKSNNATISMAANSGKAPETQQPEKTSLDFTDKPIECVIVKRSRTDCLCEIKLGGTTYKVLSLPGTVFPEVNTEIELGGVNTDELTMGGQYVRLTMRYKSTAMRENPWFTVLFKNANTLVKFLKEYNKLPRVKYGILPIQRGILCVTELTLQLNGNYKAQDGTVRYAINLYDTPEEALSVFKNGVEEEYQEAKDEYENKMNVLADMTKLAISQGLIQESECDFSESEISKREADMLNDIIQDGTSYVLIENNKLNESICKHAFAHAEGLTLQEWIKSSEWFSDEKQPRIAMPYWTLLRYLVSRLSKNQNN